MLQNLCCWLGNGNCLLPLCPDKPGLHNYGQNYIYNYFVQEHLLEEKKKPFRMKSGHCFHHYSVFLLIFLNES